MTSENTPHHHGNLRPALIQAGIDILETEGTKGLSLRKIATRVGVTHAAPAHHFKGKAALLVAIAAKGFQVFADLMEKNRDAAPKDPQNQLLGLCQGYLQFAAENEALFELIFSTDIKPHANVDEDFRKSANRAFRLLEDTCALFEPSPKHSQGHEIMIWSLVHGYASLRAYNKLISPEDGAAMPFELILPQLTPKK
ncbi:TetR/AcrR family transcriptional regulator [uncultured Litoreibacter sp.]|uniref:TetR/AcrR family transcriptional regulator n=1 Tax=uncultured Litoreibacter sp. TaxID=1392394 RepID=UPI0026214E68|nr:TetR/AcrR family transcriptional regulator [uncultured Litoreibacter sp.]